MGIRSTAKALILHDGKLLLNRCRDEQGNLYYSLPGGGQHRYETLHEAVVRECLEETGYTVQPGQLAALFESISMDEDFRAKDPEHSHKIYHIFTCTLTAAPRLKPTALDAPQTDSVWVSPEEIHALRISPEILGQKLPDMIKGMSDLFIGSARTNQKIHDSSIK